MWNTTDYNIVSNSTLQQTFKELALVKFSYRMKEEYPQLSGMAIKIFLSFDLWETILSSQRKQTQNIAIDWMQNQIWESCSPSIKPDIKEIWKNINNATLLINCFCFGKYSYFS